MPVRIYHTADNHIGISFSQYPDAVRDRLLKERFEALERMVADANKRDAHFFVVAGDLFDKLSVAAKDIKRTVDILEHFAGEAVLVLAGNHDFCEGPDSKLWKTFRKAAEGSTVLAFTAQGTKDFALEEGAVRFYACPCPSKYSAEPVTGWVADEPKDAGMLHTATWKAWAWMPTSATSTCANPTCAQRACTPGCWVTSTCLHRPLAPRAGPPTSCPASTHPIR